MSFVKSRRAKLLRKDLGEKIEIEDLNRKIQVGILGFGFTDQDYEFVECALQPQLTKNHLHKETGKEVFNPGYYLIQYKKAHHLPLRDIRLDDPNGKIYFNGFKKIGEVI